MLQFSCKFAGLHALTSENYFWAQWTDSVRVLQHPQLSAFSDKKRTTCCDNGALTPSAIIVWNTPEVIKLTPLQSVLLPTCLQSVANVMQSVINTAAQSITGLWCYNHITDTLASFHWLKALERVQFKLAPHYLAADLCSLSDMLSRRRLRSSLTDQLDVRQSQCSTVGDRSFAVAAAPL